MSHQKPEETPPKANKNTNCEENSFLAEGQGDLRENLGGNLSSRRENVRNTPNSSKKKHTIVVLDNEEGQSLVQKEITAFPEGEKGRLTMTNERISHNTLIEGGNQLATTAVEEGEKPRKKVCLPNQKRVMSNKTGGGGLFDQPFSSAAAIVNEKAGGVDPFKDLIQQKTENYNKKVIPLRPQQHNTRQHEPSSSVMNDIERRLSAVEEGIFRCMQSCCVSPLELIERGGILEIDLRDSFTSQIDHLKTIIKGSFHELKTSFGATITTLEQRILVLQQNQEKLLRHIRTNSAPSPQQQSTSVNNSFSSPIQKVQQQQQQYLRVDTYHQQQKSNNNSAPPPTSHSQQHKNSIVGAITNNTQVQHSALATNNHMLPSSSNSLFHSHQPTQSVTSNSSLDQRMNIEAPQHPSFNYNNSSNHSSSIFSQLLGNPPVLQQQQMKGDNAFGIPTISHLQPNFEGLDPNKFLLSPSAGKPASKLSSGGGGNAGFVSGELPISNSSSKEGNNNIAPTYWPPH